MGLNFCCTGSDEIFRLRYWTGFSPRKAPAVLDGVHFLVTLRTRLLFLKEHPNRRGVLPLVRGRKAHFMSFVPVSFLEC